MILVIFHTKWYRQGSVAWTINPLKLNLKARGHSPSVYSIFKHEKGGIAYDLAKKTTLNLKFKSIILHPSL